MTITREQHQTFESCPDCYPALAGGWSLCAAHREPTAGEEWPLGSPDEVLAEIIAEEDEEDEDDRPLTHENLAALRDDLDEDEVRAVIAAATVGGYDLSEAQGAEFTTYGGSYGHGYGVEVGGDEFSVMTDDEADAAQDDALDSFLDECVLHEQDGTAERYFDREAWKADAKHAGRGHSLASYDGHENEHDDDRGETLYVYRTN